MTGSRTYRLAILNSHPIQYFAPLYRRLAAEPALDLTVFYCSRQGVEAYVDPGFGQTVQWDVPLLDGYKHEFLPNLRGGGVNGFFSLINPAIVQRLRRENYDALWLHGYAHLSDWFGLLAARLGGTPVLWHCESSLSYDSRVPRSLPVRVIKPAVLRSLFREDDGFLAIGSLNRDFYRYYGAPASRIFHVPYAVDNQHFEQRAAEARRSRSELRAELGFGAEDVVFLFAAKMSGKKEPMTVLEAFRRLGDMPGKGLLMVGDGELRGEAEEFVRKHDLRDVHFTGFVNQSELPKYYAVSDVFVRPDGVYKGDWGLTVNEAMASGLAVVATDAIGATRDLVQEGVNGSVLPFGDVDALEQALRRLVEDPARCWRMGEESLRIIRGWSFEECARGVLAALESVSEGRGAVA